MRFHKDSIDGMDCYRVEDDAGAVLGYVRKKWHKKLWGCRNPDDVEFIYDYDTREHAAAALSPADPSDQTVEEIRGWNNDTGKANY